MFINPVEMGLRLKAVRMYFGDSEEDTARKTGKTAETVKRWERGGSVMRMDTLRKFCLAYHVSSDFILGMEEISKEK